jgi:hypothetical protein
VEPLALPIRARFVPLSTRPDGSPDGCMPYMPGGRFPAVLLAMDGALVLFVPAAGAGCRIGPRHPVEGCRGGGDRGRAARRRVEDWHGAVASDAAGRSGRCASGGVMPQRGSRYPPSQGLDLVELVRYLSWTGDAPVVHPPYTCSGNAPDREAARSARCGCERDARTAEVDLA